MAQPASTALIHRAPGAASAAPVLRLAWRNLWRHRRRTELLGVVVAYATISIILFWGLQDGFADSIMAGNARFLSASVLVTTRAYNDDPDPQNALGSLGFLESLRAQPEVQAAAPRLEFPALVRSAYAAEAVQARGVDPKLEAQVSGIPGRITEGRMLEQPGEIVLGAELASRLDARLGERVVLDASGVTGPQAAGLKVVGLIHSGLSAVDRGTALVGLEDARRLTGVKTATGVALAVPRGREQAVASAIQPRLPSGVRAYDLSQLLGVLASAIGTKQASIFFIGLLFSIFAALAVTSTVLVSVLERTREFGVVSAVGLSPGAMARMVTLEAIIATAIGWLVGLVLGYGLNAIFATWNILGPLFAGYVGSFSSLGLTNEIYTTQKPIYALYAAATIVLAGIFAVWIPARRVRLLNPSTALRAE